MTVTTKSEVRDVVFNLPNNLTWMRLGLTLVLYGTLAYEYYLVSLVLFLVAASTDWLDGYFARKYGMVTTLGRILDPFADKMIVCGTFIFLAAVPASQLRPWMAATVVGRELLVTALRGFIEQSGGDFSAKMAGKLKMVLQCFAIAASLFYLYWVSGENVTGENVTGGLRLTVIVSAWAAVLLTVYSGVEYIFKAVKMLRTL